MKVISKKKGEVGEVNLPDALIMSLFDFEVAIKVLPPKEPVSQALSTPYVVQKKSVNRAAAIMRSLNLPVPRKDGA
eukprot:1962116-Ditylum_brightwellii.AAC.1